MHPFVMGLPHFHKYPHAMFLTAFWQNPFPFPSFFGYVYVPLSLHPLNHQSVLEWLPSLAVVNNTGRTLDADV